MSRPISELFQLDESAYEEITDDQEEVKNTETEDTSEETTEESDPITEPVPADKQKQTRETKGSPQDKEETKEEEGIDEDFKALVTYMVDKGLIEVDEEEGIEASESALLDAYDSTVKNKASEMFNNMYSQLSNTDAAAVKFILEGGTIEEFNQMLTNGMPVDLDLSSETNQEKIIKEWYKSQGLDTDEIEDMIESYKDSDTLAKQASIAKKSYTKQQQAMLEKQVEAKKVEAERRKQEIEENKIQFRKKVLETDSLKGFNVSKRDREALYNYITQPIDGRHTQSELDVKNDIDTLLMIEYLKMKQFDFSKLEKQVASKERLRIKKSLSNFTDGNAKKANSKTQESEELKDSLPNLPWM